MKAQHHSTVTTLAKRMLFIGLIICACDLVVHAQAIYVDGSIGDDNNAGTQEAPVYSIHKAANVIKSNNNDIYVVKINPGIYILDSFVSIATDKDMTDKRIVIEASLLPGDPAWKPEKMPVITSIAPKGQIPDDYHFVASFLINESHVTIRGIKFPGYFYPNTRYFPIARLNKAKTDLLVEQCLFVGDEDASHLQVGIIAHGNSIIADHCVFYNVRNTVVFWQDAGGGSKTGNGITNSIIYGATQSGVWTAWPDNDFVFKNNIVSNCEHFWIKNYDNAMTYSMDNCVIVNNQNYQVLAANSFIPGEFLQENNVIKEGDIVLRQKDPVTHNPLPIDYLHVLPNTLGYEIGAGLFKNSRRQSRN